MEKDSDEGSYKSITLADQVESFCIFNILADSIDWYWVAEIRYILSNQLTRGFQAMFS